MSLLLLWENPLDVTEPRAHRVEVFRRSTEPTAGMAAGGLIKLEESATWGFFEDKSNSDPEAFEYEITYVNKLGNVITRVLTQNIQKVVRPDNVSIVTYESQDIFGLPDNGRTIEVSNEDDGGSRYMRFLTNPEGVAKFPIKQGARIKIRVNNELKALDVVVPRIPDLTFRTLSCYGSVVDFDRRGWY